MNRPSGPISKAATAATSSAQEQLGSADVLFSCWDGMREKNVGVTRKGDEIKRVGGMEAIHREFHRLLRLFNGEPFH